MIIQKVSDKTVASKFKRLAYFHGQLLTEDDLQEEQAYFREKLKMHNRLHGNGVVQGLQVEMTAIVSGCDDCAKDEIKPLVSISPGFALDCEGNEVVVCKSYNLDISDSIKQLCRAVALREINPCAFEENDENELADIKIGLIYGECYSNPATQYVTTCTSDAETQEYSRVREGFRVVTQLEYKSVTQSANKFTVNDGCCAYPGNEDDFNEMLIIWLAHICIGMNETQKVVPLRINDIRQYARMVDTWETARNRLLDHGTVTEHDISVIINKTVEEAKAFLAGMKLRASDDNLIASKLGNAELKKILQASPIVKEGTEITLITDKDQKYVIFGLPKS